jgi:putative mRNA 3-end processing factor
VVYAYALGKAQRLLMSIDASIGPIYTHGAVESLNDAYRASGLALPPTQRVSELPRGRDFSRALIVAPPSAQSSPWLRRFGDYADAFMSGWMQIRGVRRRRAVDRGFPLSDHADWPGLLSAIEATGAQRVYVTHGYSDPLVRWLCEHGLDAQTLTTKFTGEEGSADTGTSADEAATGVRPQPDEPGSGPSAS